MTRLRFPPFVLRVPRRRNGPRHSNVRLLLLESLDKRIVLSGVTDVAPPPPEFDQPPVSVADPAVAEDPAESIAPVYIDSSGVLHVQPPSEDSNIVVRQFVNYEQQEVVEVELEGQWTAFPVEQVQEVQIHMLTNAQRVEITEEVTVPWQLIEPELVDAVFEDSVGGPATAEVVVDAEAEPPIGGGEELSPPVISEFHAEPVGDHWVISGIVTDDDDVAGLVVVFGGLLSDEFAIVQADGTFSYTVFLPPGENGLVSAIVTDADGLDSNLASTWIQS